MLFCVHTFLDLPCTDIIRTKKWVMGYYTMMSFQIFSYFGLMYTYIFFGPITLSRYGERTYEEAWLATFPPLSAAFGGA
jgi:hypothetical protein